MKENEAVKFLEDCEQNLRKVVAEAIAEGDYTSVLRVTDWAKAIAALAAEARAGRPAASRALARPANRDANGQSAVPCAAQGRRKPGPDEYPKFFRRGDELVKVGWSKKERKEYNHRAPRHAVDAVTAAVRQVGARGKLFNGDTLLPLEHESGSVPDYQAYVALAWLKHLGIVVQHGRKSGYTLAPDKQIDSIVTAAWPELSEWQG